MTRSQQALAFFFGCQVLHELQIVLAIILGACPLCCQPLTLDRLVAALAGT